MANWLEALIIWSLATDPFEEDEIEDEDERD